MPAAAPAAEPGADLPAGPARRSAPSRRRRDEHGAAAVEFLLIAPLLMLMCLLLIQYAIRAEAARVINAAAREGAVATASWNGDETTGRQTALDYLAALDPRVTNRTATAVRRPGDATVTVTGDVLSLLPGVDLRVSATATVPTERFVP